MTQMNTLCTKTQKTTNAEGTWYETVLILDSGGHVVIVTQDQDFAHSMEYGKNYTFSVVEEE